MTVQYLNIEARQRQMTGFLASLADFTLSDGDTVSADILLSNPNLSLYCLDDTAKRAIFVELPGDVDLAAAPFVYRTQYEQAQRLLAVPYDTFRQLAQSLPPVQNLILMYISGRSGSTLLNHIFNALDTVLSLSEPDVITQFVHLRWNTDGQRDPELRELLDCTVHMLCKPTPLKTPTTYALKFRNEGLQVMDLYQATFPQAKNLFLYRDALGYVASFYRIFKRDGFPESTPVEEVLALFRQLQHPDFGRMAVYLDPDVQQMSIPQQLTLWWLFVMECYLAQYERGIPVLAVNYKDLNESREQVLNAIFEYCGLPVEQMTKTLEVFERDAQAGTVLARENPSEGNSLRLSEAQQDEVLRILARHPVVNHSDFIVPGTLQL